MATEAALAFNRRDYPKLLHAMSEILRALQDGVLEREARRVDVRSEDVGWLGLSAWHRHVCRSATENSSRLRLARP